MSQSDLLAEMEQIARVLRTWEEALREINQQAQHGWQLKDYLSSEDADKAVQEAWKIAGRLQELAELIKSQAEQAGGTIDD
jgi:hypothetical protein